MAYPGDSEGDNESSGGTDLGATGTPRWVKVFALAALVAIVVFIVLLLTGRGGEHGPGRHGVDTRLNAIVGDAGATASSADAPAALEH